MADQRVLERCIRRRRLREEARDAGIGDLQEAKELGGREVADTPFDLTEPWLRQLETLRQLSLGPAPLLANLADDLADVLGYFG